MVVQGFKITLDNPSACYSPGQYVSGKVLCHVVGDEALTEIFIRFFGFAYTKWTDVIIQTYHRHSMGHGHGHHDYHISYPENVDYEASEPLFNVALRLFGNGATVSRIPVGDNAFPFAFQLPKKPLPLNCFFEDGSVQYGVEAQIIVKPGMQPLATTATMPLTLLPVVDLNANSAIAAKPIQMAVDQNIGCCCSAKPCYLKSWTPTLGFVQGDDIPCIIQIDNTSSEEIQRLTAILTQVWTLFSDNKDRGRHSRTKSIPLQTATNAGIGPGQKFTWDVNLMIPSTFPPTPDPSSCELFKMEYTINITAAVDAPCSKNLTLAHPVLVGTIPLKSPATDTVQFPKYDEKGGLA